MLKVIRLLTIIVAGLAIVAGAGRAALYVYPGLALLAIRPQSVSPFCSLGRAIANSGLSFQQAQHADAIAQASRLLGHDGALDLWQTPAGRFWIPGGNARILPILLAQQRREIYGDQTWGVHRGDIVLDCGAHVGVFAKKALEQGARVVVLVEPSPLPVECLRRNFAREIADRKVVLCPKGIWDHEGTLSFFVNGAGGAGGSFVEHTDDSRRLEGIPVTTIDQIARDLALPHIDFIKTDVKGATLRAMIGAREVLSRFGPRLALSTEEHDEDITELAAAVRSIRSQYEMRCGPCLVAFGQIYTDVLFFR